MSLKLLPIRTTIALVALAPVLLASAPSHAYDRLVDACEAAVEVHAHEVELNFPTADRQGLEVELTVAFETDGTAYIGEARCSFRSADPDGVPSLSAVQAMGKSGAAMFLISHHAVWEHFSAPAQEASMPGTELRKEPPSRRPAKRRQFAAGY